MARLHSHRKGRSQSMRPALKKSPSWVTYSNDEVVGIVVQLAKEGLTPSQIGLKLRDEHNIPLAKTTIGKSVQSILKENEMSSALPEDLEVLTKKAVRLREHLQKYKADHRNIRSLELLEAKIHRLAKHYKLKGTLDKSWKYSTMVAQLA
ncbi:MAG: 30S ribosomal protein S15 [Nitrososphaerales archaeon]